jgi:hypothetical protein
MSALKAGAISGPNAASIAIGRQCEMSLDTKNILIATAVKSPLPPVPVDNAVGKIVCSTGALIF